MKKILLTGGGTAGHVNPNLALLPHLKKAGLAIEYMGSYNGIEKGLVEAEGIPYFGISSGKLRRYLAAENVTDMFRVIKGLHEARQYMKTYRPDVVFSKGGFVSVPVVAAASEHRIPVVIHESDLTPGLANKLSIFRASRICYSFPETAEYVPRKKAIHTGLPIRGELISGSAENGRKLCGFSSDKPVLTIIGGSLGSLAINIAVRKALPELLKDFYIIHICGEDKTDPSLDQVSGYKQFEYVGKELPDFFAASEMIISRAGANAIHELAFLQKPAILIPLEKATRGDQLLNADSFAKRGFSVVLQEKDLTTESLLTTVRETFENRDTYIRAMAAVKQEDAAAKVAEVILSVLK